MAALPRDGVRCSISSIDPAVKCYEGALPSGELSFAGGSMAWTIASHDGENEIPLEYSAILAMGFTECCAKLGHGKVSLQ